MLQDQVFDDQINHILWQQVWRDEERIQFEQRNSNDQYQEGEKQVDRVVHGKSSKNNLTITQNGIIPKSDYLSHTTTGQCVPRSIHSDQYKRLTTMLLATRKNAGLTQQDVADKLGKPQSYVAKIEGNERRIDLVEFVALAKALGIDPNTMFANALSAISKSK